MTTRAEAECAMDSIIDYFKEFLYLHRLTSLIGLLAFVILIWFVSPSLGITLLTTKITIIVSIISIYLVIILIYWLWRLHERKKVLKQEAIPQIESTEKQVRILALKEKMQKGIATLKTSTLGKNYRGSKVLYALPWYVVIGTETTGKSTLLQNSNLHFSLMNQVDKHNHILDGTDNCDWWFSEEAVLIDTAGRYTSSSDAHEEWLVFLKILKQKRPRLPINGILLVLSFADILLGTELDILNFCKNIRERIVEIYQEFKFIIPVYIIFNKVDLLPGFGEFFSDLNEDERGQILGVTLQETYQKYEKFNFFSQKISELYTILTYLRMHKLAVERSQKRKFLLYNFPDQFIATHGHINLFLNSFLRKTPYQEAPDVYGVYFTSSTQKDLVVKPSTESLTQVITVSSNIAKEDKVNGFFITDLLRHVVFNNCIPLTRPLEQLLLFRWLKSAALISSIGIIIIAGFIYITSFTANTILLHRGKIIAEQVRSDLSDQTEMPGHIYYSLRTAFDFYTQLVSNHKMLPWYLRLGLYRGDAEIPIYQKLLNQLLIRILQVPMQAELETKLEKLIYLWQNNSALRESIRGNYYAQLRWYLMLCYPKYMDFNFASHELLQFLLANMKAKTGDVDVNQAQALSVYYLSQLKKTGNYENKDMAWHVKLPLVVKAREQLRTATGIENLYAFMIMRGLNQLGYTTLSELIPNHQADLLFSNFQLPNIYTRQGWQDYISPAIEQLPNEIANGDWVIQSPLSGLYLLEKLPISPSVSNTEIAKFKQILKQMYLQNYLQAWSKLIQSIQIKPFTSFDDTARKLDILSQQESPLTQILFIVADNSSITHFNTVTKLVKQSFENNQQLPPINQSLTATETKIFLSAEEKNSIAKPLQNYLHLLNNIKKDNQRLTASSDSLRDANLIASQLLNGTDNMNNLLQATLAIDGVLSTITDLDLKNSLQKLLLTPIRNAWQVILQAASQDLQRQWQQKILLHYQQTLVNRFPFVHNQNDASYTEVANFFRPQTGDLWHFVNTDLFAYLIPNNSSWESRTWIGLGVNFNVRFLQSLIAGKEITEGLFQQGSEMPAFNVQVYPIPTPGLSQITLESNGVRLNYRNGPQEWSILPWQARTNSDAALMVIAAHQTGESNITQQGTWALWRLLTQANLIVEADGIVSAEWLLSIQGKHYPIRILFKMDGNNLLREILINGWQLPTTIIA